MNIKILTLHHCPVDDVLCVLFCVLLSNVLLCLRLLCELVALSTTPALVLDSYALPPFVSFLLVIMYDFEVSWRASALFKVLMGLFFTFVGLWRLFVLVDNLTGDFLRRDLACFDVSWLLLAFSESSAVLSLLIASSLDWMDGVDSSEEESVESPRLLLVLISDVGMPIVLFLNQLYSESH